MKRGIDAMHPVYRLISLLLFLALAPAAALAQSQTLTIGTDFWLGFMKNYQTTAGQALNLFIVSDQATSGTVSVPGQGWSQSFTVSPNVTTTITIPNAVAEVALNQTVQGRGVHIESVADIAVFAINFITHTADGSKVLTTQALGTKYVAAAYSGLAPYNSEILIVATEDNTEVEITPKCATSAGNAANVPFLVQLNQGDCYQLMAVAGQDLTGTSITGTEASGSCRPFAVFSGAGCSNIPSGCVACDHIYEQNYPLNLWGIDFFVTPFVFNLNPVYGVSVPNYTYRVLAAQNGTSISIDGGAPFTLNAGQFQEFNYQTGAHCIAASLPVTVAQYMEGISCGGNGDPAMLIIDDITKKIDYITFSTVQSSVITDHYLNVVVDAADIGTVTLDGVVIDPGLFQGFGSCSNLMWAGFPLTPGSHTLDSQGTGVSGYVYGYGDSESYAYTVGSGTFETTDMLEIDEAICTNNQVIMQIDPEFLDPVWYNYAFPGDTLAQTHTYTLNQPVTNGVYMVTANHFISGCEETFYYSVEVPQPPPLTVYPNATVNICQYESVQLNAVALPASATYYYNWTPVAGLSDPHIAN
ncbi:MAG: IgGFc-binding protein, partial [Crocinitomicaceae bacterium]|nr:IgGFc-binding protein [Crocinitomicaceae bacterium]